MDAGFSVFVWGGRRAGWWWELREGGRGVEGGTRNRRGVEEEEVRRRFFSSKRRRGVPKCAHFRSANNERETGSDGREKGCFVRTDELGAAAVIEVSTRELLRT